MDGADKFVLLDQIVTKERLLRFGFLFNDKSKYFEKDYHINDNGDWETTFEYKNNKITYLNGYNCSWPITFNIHNMYDLIRFYENYCSKNPITKIP